MPLWPLKTWQGNCRVTHAESAFAWPADYVEASAPYTSAHQMGTARMGADPSTSVCDPNGESWDVSGLVVCDGAALPTSIGEPHELCLAPMTHHAQLRGTSMALSM